MSHLLRLALAGVFSIAAGSAWLSGGDSLLGPLCSVGLPLAVMLVHSGKLNRMGVALGYYLVGCWPIVGAVTGYWGPEHWRICIIVWLVSSMILSVPWMLASGPSGVLMAILITALPPIGVIGWLSPMNAAGVLFPGSGWFGLLLFLLAIPASYQPGRLRKYGAPALILGAIGFNLEYREAMPPPGWVGVQTAIRPSNGNVLKGITNNQEVIEAGLHAGAGAKVVVFPEAVLDNWYSGTQYQFSHAVPKWQTWLIGAESKNSGSDDAVMLVKRGHPSPVPAANAAGLLLGGDWLPWKKNSLQPAWWQSVFVIDNRRVWASLCVEQVQPWAWLEAMAQRPDLILAMTNDWWAQSMTAPGIQMASTRSWARLMHLPLVVAVNHP